MIAIVGKIASGKTTFLKSCASLGYSTFSCDEYVNYLYTQNSDFINKIKQNIGEFLIKNNQVSKDEIKKWIRQDLTNLQLIEKEVFLEIKSHLQQHQYDFVEIPILATKIVDFSTFFSLILNMQISPSQHEKLLKNKGVDNFVLEILLNQNAYNWEEKDFFRNKKVVNIPLNKRDNLDKIKLLLHEIKQTM
ncbi:dephospho-CoA kinase [Mycoplasma seminis]|uniref:Dephospho-CoA kinase n=1 Tax=Mycoplasma seminis TaxID=512749 RepID=A0ABY9HBH6_9MOLU|nr:dephospho-CoA kinase [Mycoplasma seminis]WLP85955.1 dephospho-CoA kinase [Mycoplasma seminis]